MRKIIFPALLAFLIAAPAHAGGTLDCWLRQSDCRDLVGKRFWVRPMGAETMIEMTAVQGDWKDTARLTAGALVITGIVEDRTMGADLAVKLSDGRTGWISHMSAHLLSPTDPVADAKEAAILGIFNRKDCERRGQPRIGMTAAELVETCWRSPARIVKKTTAAGIEESYLYGIGRIVKLNDGKITEIVEAR